MTLDGNFNHLTVCSAAVSPHLCSTVTRLVGCGVARIAKLSQQASPTTSLTFQSGYLFFPMPRTIPAHHSTHTTFNLVEGMCLSP